MINFCLATDRDTSIISTLHRQYINMAFLSSLGVVFLKMMYESMINSQYAFCIVAKDEKRIIGFVAGTVNVCKFYKEFLKKRFFKASIILLPKFLNSKFTRKFFETLFYPLKKEKDLPTAELLSIVVEKEYQGKKVSQRLFEELVKEFKKRSITKFKVVAGSNLISACKFYEKMGGILHSVIEVHKGEKSKVYVWNI